MNLLSSFSAFLRANKERVVRSKEVLVSNWSDTYGMLNPASEEIDYVDFDAMCEVMDEFARSFDPTKIESEACSNDLTVIPTDGLEDLEHIESAELDIPKGRKP